MGITRIKDSKTQQTGGQKWQNTHKNNEYPPKNTEVTRSYTHYSANYS